MLRRLLGRRKLFTEKDVASFRPFPDKVIGRGGIGPVFLAKIRFRGQKRKFPQIVAVKELSMEAGVHPKELKKIILGLRKQKVKIPKTWVIEHEGRWYQVMEAFKKEGKSKFLENMAAYIRFSKLTTADRPLIESIAKDYAGVFNAGYICQPDCENYMRVNEGKKETYYFVDLNLLKRIDRRTLAKEMFMFYQGIVSAVPTNIKDPGARALFLETFGKSLGRRLKPYWQRVITSETTKLNEFLRIQSCAPPI